MATDTDSIVIGRNDKADFPELHLKNIDLKIDSGAYTSAIHCSYINKNDNEVLEVVFLDGNNEEFTGKTHRFKDFHQKTVRSSNGAAEDRFIILTKMELGKEIYDIQLSLTCRADMRSPVLIGRKFLSKNHFIVNPRLRNRLYKKSVKAE